MRRKMTANLGYLHFSNVKFTRGHEPIRTQLGKYAKFFLEVQKFTAIFWSEKCSI